MKFHHIGYLTTNFQKTVKEFSLIKYKVNSKIIDDRRFKVKILFIKNSFNRIELIKPYNNNIGLKKLIKKKILSYHFAYTSKSFTHDYNKLKKRFKLIVNPTPAKAFNGRLVCFLKMKNDFIIEIIESSK